MKIVRGSNKLSKKPAYSVVTLGNFDGIHIGHRKILKKVVQIAGRKRGTSILYTFEPHPVKVLSPELAPPLIQTLEQKVALIEDIGLDLLVIERFTKSLSQKGPNDFFRDILCKRLNTREIVVGYDFTFGQHRTGKIEDMEKMAKSAGIKIHIIDAIFLKESLISSTHIRHFIEKGNLTRAKAMLGRPYSIEGTIIKGRGIGAELGFHTANLKPDNELIPPPGVYITMTTLKKGGCRFKSATNIGYNPTIGGTKLSIETHLLNFDGKIIGEKIQIEFYKKIRREMTFDSIKDLRRQIVKDVGKTRNFYEKRI